MIPLSFKMVEVTQHILYILIVVNSVHEVVVSIVKQSGAPGELKDRKNNSVSTLEIIGAKLTRIAGNKKQQFFKPKISAHQVVAILTFVNEYYFKMLM